MGTTNPSVKLQINGSLAVNSSSQNKTYGSYPFDYTFNTLATNILRVNMTGGGNYDRPTLSLFNDNSGATDWVSPRLQLSTWGQGSGSSIDSQIETDSASTPGLKFNVKTIGGAALATSPAFQFQNNGGNLFTLNANGNVGIGTSNPTEKLHVSGGVNGNYGTGLKISGPSADNNWLGGITLSNSSETLTARMYSSTGGLMFDYNGVERMRIATTGNVGIGTTSVSSYANGFLFNNEIGPPSVSINSTGSLKFHTGGYPGTADTGISRLSAGIIGVGSGTQRDSSGTLIASNVGIGTTALTAKIEVKGTG